MSEHRNMILAIVLSAIVLFGWGIVTEHYFPTASEPSSKIVDGKQVPVRQPSAGPAGAPTVPQAAPAAPAAPVRTAERVRIDTPRLRGSISMAGATIDDLELLDYGQTIAEDAPRVRLFSRVGTPNASFARFGWAGDERSVPPQNAEWTKSGDVLTQQTPVTLQWRHPGGELLFEILLSVDADYMFTAQQRVVNRSGHELVARPFTLVSRIGPSPDPDSWTMHVGPVGVFGGSADYGNNWDDVAAGTRSFNTRGGWLGFTDKYWLTAVIPDQATDVEASFAHNGGSNSYQAGFVAAPETVGPGQQHRYTSRLFAGAKEVQLLDRYSDELGTPLERAIDWGWFRWFMIPIFWLLNALFSVIGNFGVAIIGLTVIVRLLLFPIAQKQFASMAAMRVLQPKIKQLQERYKDDKPRMQQEMLKLYKEEKVNPMAGCLPILLQIPIFYALYKVLMLAVEMRHRPFALWIEDLSAPDPLTPVNLFGFLDFTPPGLLAIGVLPILLGVTMWLQFKLNPAPMDPVQQKVFAFMPWVLMFIMAPFAAGLQLYWTVSNIISIGQQKLLYARHPVLKTQAAAAAPAPAPAPSAPEPAPPAPPAAPRPRRKPKPRGR